jgi:hypothetical protein
VSGEQVIFAHHCRLKVWAWTTPTPAPCDAKEKSVFAKSKVGRKEMDALLFSASPSAWLVDHSSQVEQLHFSSRARCV